MSVQLSSGALKAINDGTQVDKPVFQLLALKKLNQSLTTNNAVDRYRILLSDGIHNNSAMLAVQLNQMVTDGKLEANTVICLERYVCNSLAGNRRVVIVLEVNVVATAAQVGGKMGNPVALPLGTSTGGSANGQQAAAPQQSIRQPAASPMSVGKANSFLGAGGSYSKPNFGGAGTSPPKQAQPISSLTPYQNRWTIKARVSNKSNVRTWSNSRGEGKLFSMDLCDQSGEIRATAFKDQCDKFYDLIEVGKVYYISRGTLKSANRQYTSITNDYEMTFNNDTTMVPCEEEDETIPTMQFDFRTVAQLENMSKDSMLENEVESASSSSSGPQVTKPVATVLPIPSPSATSATSSRANQAAPGQSHQITILHPVPGEGVTQQVLPGFPIVASQRFMVPGPRGTQQQVFGFPGMGPVIRIMHHQHSGPGPRTTLPNTSTAVLTGTTGTSPSGFVVHHNLVAGHRPETPVSSSVSATTSTMSSCTVHHHHVVHGPRVVFSNAPSNLSSGNATTTAAPTFVMHHQHPITGPRPGMPAITAVSSTTVPSPTTSTVNAGAAFQIQFQCRPGQPPTPMIRFFPNAPPPPPGTHRCMQGQQGGPVFRSPVPSTTAPQTSCAPTPSTAPQATPMQVRPPGYPRNAAAPEIELNAKPELAALAQHIRNIAADVKPAKTGNTRGGPMDMRQNQERRAAALTSLRKKAARAKNKAESTSAPIAETSVDDIESPSNDNKLPANNPNGPAEESAATSISGDSSRRRKKRRKRAKQQSPSSETAGQSSVSDPAADSQTGQHQGREPATEKDGNEKSINEEVAFHPEPNSAASSRSYDEDKLTDDSDDGDSSEFDSELVSCPYSKSDDARQSLSSQSASSGKSSQMINKPLSISKDDQASTNDATKNSKKLSESKQDAKVDAGSHETELQTTATGSSKVNDASQISLSEGAEAQSSMEPSVSENSQVIDVTGKAESITEVTEGVGSKSGQVSQPLDPPEAFKPKVTSREGALDDTDFVSHVEPNLAANQGVIVEVTDTVVQSNTEETVLKTDAISESEVPNESLSNVQTDAKSVAQPPDNSQKDAVLNVTQVTATKTEKNGSSSQTTSNCELDGVQSSNLGLKSVRPKVQPSPTASRSDVNFSVKQDPNAELQQDHLDFERKQLALERKRLDFERQRLLLEQERLLMAEDHLKTERERLKAMQEQVQLQRDQLGLDQRRFDLERERVEVDREYLQVERHRLRTEEQRAENSKIIVSSLQEISQTLQMSVGLSFQQYGFPVSYDSDGGAASEQQMQEQGYIQAMSGEALPADTATFEERPPEEEGDEWTVVGGTRASSGHHQSMPQWMPTEVSGESLVTADQGAQSGWPTENPSRTLDSEYLQTLEEMTQPRASGDLSATSQWTGRTGESSNEEQRSHEGRRSSPVHNLSSIGGRRATTHNSSQRQSRGGRSDGRRGRSNDGRKNKKSKPGD